MDTVGVRELRQYLSVYLDRVRKGEHLVVTERNIPVAKLVPLDETRSAVDRLVAEGKLIPAIRPGPIDFKPIKLRGSARPGSEALEYVRGER